MRLRERIVLTLLAITVILAIPAVFGLVQLSTLKSIADQLQSRDTRATQTLGRLRTSLEALQSAEDNYVVLWNISRDTAAIWQRSAASAMAQIDDEIGSLQSRPHSSAQYRAAVDAARRQWAVLKRAVQQEQAGLGQDAQAEQRFRSEQVKPAFAAMVRGVAPVTSAIEREADDRVQRAARVARSARNTTLAALALALALTVVIGSLMTGALVRPIGELRKGMARVAEGDFEPDVRVPAERTDELGDLARSFGTMTEQLAELDRLKAEVVSVASHEIKTPLSVIRGYVALLADGIYGQVNDQQKKTLEAVSDQVDRLTRLVHRLLDISRFEAGGGRLELRRINVRDFLDELTSGFRVLAFQNGIDFHVDVAGDTPVNIEGDADRLNEVLGNLLSNAFKFTERGGRITLSACRDGTGVEVEVADTGVGIPPDKLPKIFEKFYQVENPAQPRSAGSGLGLAIAREIVEAHGGTIGAESAVGEGTRFRVTLPERPPASRAAESHAHVVRR
jgi:signal transduction histidine kinase